MAVDAGTIYSEIRLKLDKLNADIASVNVSFDKLNTGLQDSSTKTKETVKDNLNQINFAHVAVFAAIAAMVKKSISVYADFQQSMKNVQSVARATPEEFAKLEAAAEEAGETTRFTASQAADALYYLASAGLNANQSVAALSGVLELAGATGSDLAFTAEAVTATLSQFNLEAKESGRIANVFTAAIANSQATMAKLATSMKYVGPIAQGFDIQLENVVGTLQALYNAGFEGEQAGTALRNILGDLSNAASPAIKRLDALGVSFEQVNPAAHNLTEIIQNLGNASLTTGNIMAIFGDRAGPIMVSLLSKGASAIDKYTKAVTNTNAAAEAYAIQNDSLAGSIDFLKSAVEGATIKTVKEFEPALRFIIDTVTKLVGAFTKLPAEIKIFLGVAAVLVTAIAGINIVMGLFAGLTAATLGPILAVVGGVSALVAISVALNKAYVNSIDNTENLKKAHVELDANTKALTKSIEDYDKINKQLNDNTKILNATERETLENRKKIAGLEIAANLKNTVEALQKLDTEQQKQNKTILQYQSNVNYFNAAVTNSVKTIKDLTEESKKYGPAARTAEARLISANQILNDNTNSLKNNRDGLAKAQLALAKSNEERQKQIDILANAFILGQIDIQLVASYNKVLAKEIEIRAKQIEKIKEKQVEQKKENDTVKTGTELTEKQKQGNEKLTEQIQKLKEKTQDLNATDKEKIELSRQREIADVRLSGATIDMQNKAIAAINLYYDTLIKVNAEEEKAKKRKEDASKALEKYKTNIEKAKQKQDEAKKALEEYNEELAKNLEQLPKNIFNSVATIADAINSLIDVTKKQQIDAIAEQTKAQLDALDIQLQKKLEAEGLAEETTLQRLQRELQEAFNTGDAIAIKEADDALKKQQFIEEYNNKKNDIEEKAAKETANINYKASLDQWGLENISLASKQIVAIMNAWASAPWPFNLPAIIATGIETGALIAKQAATKPTPPKLQTGGIVLGSSLGTPAILGENNTNELALNDSAAGSALLDNFADRIAIKMRAGAGAGGNINVTVIMQLDNKTIAQGVAEVVNNGVVTFTQRSIK